MSAVYERTVRANTQGGRQRLLQLLLYISWRSVRVWRFSVAATCGSDLLGSHSTTARSVSHTTGERSVPNGGGR
jgi:hypothetical protein